MIVKVNKSSVFGLALLVGMSGTLANSTTKVGKSQPGGLVLELGRVDFLSYCAACHGVGGKGDGTVAEYLTLAAPDLTQLRKMNAGTFPRERIQNVIDGRAGGEGSWGARYARMG